MQQSIDGFLPQPTTELGEWRNFVANATAYWRSVSKHRTKIPVQKVYNCFECGNETTYWEPGGVCGPCEARGESQFENSRGN